MESAFQKAEKQNTSQESRISELVKLNESEKAKSSEIKSEKDSHGKTLNIKETLIK